MERQELRDFKKYIDLSFKEFSRTYGDGIESFFDPLLYFLLGNPILDQIDHFSRILPKDFV